MSTYFNDCSSLTGWTEQAVGAGTQFSVSAGTITASGTTQETLSLDAVDSDAERQDCEILFKVKIGTISTTHYVGLVRGSDSDSASTLAGYFVVLRGTAIRTYYKTSGGSLTQISTAAATVSSDTYYWVRLRVNSTTIRARYWADGGSEGGTWDCDATDSNVSGDGYAGLYKDTVNTASTWDTFGVGTNGDTAPASAGGTVTGDGTLAAGVATTSGTAEREVKGSGTPASGVATTAGTAEREITGTSALASGAATTSGTAEREITGTSALASGVATVAGTAEREITGTSSLASGAATTSGTAEREITGTSALLSGVATTSGAGVMSRNATGTLLSEAATLEGVGTVGTPAKRHIRPATMIVSGPATMSGTGSVAA